MTRIGSRVKRAICMLAMCLSLAACPIGDPAAEPGLRVVNNTNGTVHIYGVNPDGEEIQRSVVTPHSEVDTYIACAAGELVARTPAGQELGRRGPFDDCNETPWVIGEGS